MNDNEQEREQNEDVQDDNVKQIQDELENVLSSYEDGQEEESKEVKPELSEENLLIISEEIENRITEIKEGFLPPIEKEINDINRYIEQKYINLEKAKTSTVFVNELADDVEFYYSDYKVKVIEEDIKVNLDRRYSREKEKFSFLEELEVLNLRSNICKKLKKSYQIKENVMQLEGDFQEVIENTYFDIEDYSVVTSIELESIESWELNWNTILKVVCSAYTYQNEMKELREYFLEVQPQFEENDIEKLYVIDEMQQYPDFDPVFDKIISESESLLFTSTAALYELISNYEVGNDYFPEYKQNALSKINKLKSLLITLRSQMDNCTTKLEYKNFRKSLNNIFVSLNKCLQMIENEQKNLKARQDTRTRKLKELVILISKTAQDRLKNSTDEINAMIATLENLDAPSSEIAGIQYYFSIKAGYPVYEDTRDQIVSDMNYEKDMFTINEIALMCQMIGTKYDNKSGFYLDRELLKNKNVQPLKPLQPLGLIQPTQQAQQIQKPPQKQIDEINISQDAQIPHSKGKTGNLEFLGNLYLKEAQRSKGSWSIKSYMKAIESFMKGAELEDILPNKLKFLKQALKTSKDALTEKKEGSTLYAYAQSYREFAYNHPDKMNHEIHLRIGDNFVNAGTNFLKEYNEGMAKKAFEEALDAYNKYPNDPQISSRISTIQRNFLK